MERGDRTIGHHHAARLGEERSQQAAGAGQQAVADHHLVGVCVQRHRDAPVRAGERQRLGHAFGGSFGRVVAAIHREISLCVEGGALLVEARQCGQRVAMGQQGPLGAAGDAAEQGRQGAAQPDRDRAFAHQPAGARIDHGAAAGGDHRLGPGDQARDHAALACAELGLAVAGEDFRHRAAGGALDLVVGVDEGEAEADRELAADRGLAGSHQAHEDQRAAAEPVQHGLRRVAGRGLRRVAVRGPWPCCRVGRLPFLRCGAADQGRVARHHARR